MKMNLLIILLIYFTINKCYKNIYILIIMNEDGIHFYHIYINEVMIKELINNQELRFFKSNNKHILHNFIQYNINGYYIQTCSWDLQILNDAFKISKKINNCNFIKYICYFEYEDDILEYLCSFKNNIDEKRAIIIFPYYYNLKDINLEKNELLLIIKQLIMIIYVSLFKYNIIYTNININNIFIDYKKVILSYKINNKIYKIQSNILIKFNEFINIKKINNIKELTIDDIHLFYNSIIKILKDLSIKYDLVSLINFINDFNFYSQKIAHPYKILDIILSQFSVYLL